MVFQGEQVHNITLEDTTIKTMVREMDMAISMKVKSRLSHQQIISMETIIMQKDQLVMR